MYFSRIIIASIIGVASIKTTLVAAADVCVATDEQNIAYFVNVFAAMSSISPECQGDEAEMTPECITELLGFMDTACDATDGMAILAVESEVDCGDLDTENLDGLTLPQNGKACVPDLCTMDAYKTYIKAETDGECSFGAPNACSLSPEQTLTLSIEAMNNFGDSASECFVDFEFVESDKCEKLGTEATEKACTATDGLKVAKFGDLTCPDSVELDLGMTEPGPDGQVCVPTACKEADYVDYLSDNTPEECTFSAFSASSAGFSARSSAMLVTSTVLAAALALLM